MIVDYCETVFHPRMVSKMMSFDKPEEPDADSAARSFLEERNHEGIMFYKQPGPILLQTKFPHLLTVLLDFTKLHGFAAHERRCSGTSTSCGANLNDIHEYILKNVGLTKISHSKSIIF